MSINTSAEDIREMANGIEEMIKDIEASREEVRTGLSNTATTWQDDKGEAFREVMEKVLDSLEPATEELRLTLTKLEELAEKIDDYNKVEINIK